MTITIISKSGKETKLSQVTSVSRIDNRLEIITPFVSVTFYRDQYDDFTIEDDRQRRQEE